MYRNGIDFRGKPKKMSKVLKHNKNENRNKGALC